MLHAEKLGWRPLDEDEVVHNMAGAAKRLQQDPPAIFLWERYVTHQYVDAGIMRCVDVIRAPWPGFVITARKDFFEQHAEVIEQSLAILRSEAEALKDGPHTAELVMQNAGFSEELAHEWLQHARWKVAPPEAGAFDNLTATLRQLGLV